MTEYLKTRSEQLGISRNAFLIWLLQKDMEQGIAPEDPDAYIEKIVSGVAEHLSGMITAFSVMDMKSIVSCNADREATGAEKADELSNDAMDFLSCF